MRRFIGDDRGVAISVGSILLFAVTIIALTVILLSFSQMMTASKDVIMREHFKIMGRDITVRLTDLDTMITAAEDRGESIGGVEYDLEMPMLIVDRYYRVQVTQDELILSSDQGKNTMVRIPYNTTTPVQPTVIYSAEGEHVLRYNASAGRIEIR